MTEVDLTNVSGKDLSDYDKLRESFKTYMTETIGYTEEEADFILSTDFKDPYDTPYITQEYEGEYTIDGTDYEILSCHTVFSAIGMWHLSDTTPFSFYMCIDKSTMPDETVGSYLNARKMYIL